MESEKAEGYVGLTKDEIRLIWAVNYFGREFRNLNEFREFVDRKMNEFEERNPGLKNALVWGQNVADGESYEQQSQE